MPLLPASTDYTDRDFTALRARMRSLVVSVFPNWTDDKTANFANLLVELYCWVGDVIAFYQNNQAGESRIRTATQMKNMLGLAQLIGYTPRSPRAAQTDITIMLSAPVGDGRSVTFTPPWKNLHNPVTARNQDTANPLEFELQNNIVIEEGHNSGTGRVKNSRHVGDPDDLVSNPGETFLSTGLPNQKYRLGQAPYLDGSIAMQDEIGGWAQAEANSLATAGPTARVFRIERDAESRATLVFGNGVTGAIPTGTVRLAYETGGGAAGNSVALSGLQKIDGSFVNDIGDSIYIAGTVHQSPTGGLDAETIEEIRELAPLSIQTISRTVTKGDYENQARLAGMKRALLVTQSENGGLRANTAQLFCVPLGRNGQGGEVSAGQREDVIAHFTEEPSTRYPNAKPGIVGFAVTVLAAPYVDIGIRMRIYLRSNVVAGTVATNIVEAIKAYFALVNGDGTRNRRVDFGLNLGAASRARTMEVPIGDLMTIVSGVAGVREVGDTAADFQLAAYRVLEETDGYTSGMHPAELVQALAHSDVPLQMADFPRLKMTVLGYDTPDITILDGDNGDAQLYPPA